MMKIVVAARRRAGMSHEAHVKYFEQVHAGIVLGAGAAVLGSIAKYVQSHVFDAVYNGPASATNYDSVGELWFTGAEALQRTMGDPYTITRIRPDESNFSDSTSLLVSMVSEQAVPVSQPRNSSVKLMHFIYRAAGTTGSEFAARWHAATLALAESPELTDGIRHFVRSHPLNAEGAPPDGAPPGCDGINSVWFDEGSHAGVLLAYQRCAARIESQVGSFSDPLRSFILLAKEVAIHPVVA